MSLIFGLLLSFVQPSFAFVSSCITYDVVNESPDDLRVPMFIKCMHKGSTLYLDGGIDENLIYEITTYAPQPITKISLNSGGGRVEAAFELAEYIRQNGIVTEVREGALCASACTLLFQAGAQRSAHATARFMYHGARRLLLSSDTKKRINLCLESPTEECQQEILQIEGELRDLTEEMFALYEKLGASPLLAETYWSLPEEDDWLDSGNFLRIEDWWPSNQELVDLNVITDLVSS